MDGKRMSAQKLGIRQSEYVGLSSFVDAARSGMIRPTAFDMRLWQGHYCDTDETTHCIGGWARTFGADVPDYGPDRKTEDLYYPSTELDGWSPFDATLAEATNVVEHFLHTGVVDWSKR